MKAIQVHTYGPADTFTLEEVEQPMISSNELLIKIHAASVNHIDALKASGVIKYIYPLQFPWIPGSDFAGVVEETGSEVTEYKKGDLVYGSNTNGGAYATFIAVRRDQVSKMPAKLNFIEAASVPMVATTAWQGLFEHGHLKKNQTVLIHGAAGAVGGYAVQLARNAGARVIATAKTKNIEYVKSLGAMEVIDYTITAFEDEVQNVDLVFDLVGGEVQQRSYAVVKEGGYLIAANQPVSDAEAKRYKIHALFMHARPTATGLEMLAHLFDEGKLKTDIAQVYPLADAATAWKNIGGNLAVNKSSRLSKKRSSDGLKHGKHVLEM